MSVLSMPLADTEQTAGLQSLTPDCLHDVGYAMFSVSPVLLWRYQIESKHDWPLVFQQVSLIEMREECTAAEPRTRREGCTQSFR